MLKDFIAEYSRYRITGEKAIRQVSDSNLNRVIGADNNSIAIIVRHLSGNLLSRFTDFLTSDGEKAWRDRDSEFENRSCERVDVEQMWSRGWDKLETELSRLNDEHLLEKVRIRGVEWTVHDALCRSLAHVAYHIGQIVLLARTLNEDEWEWISIPKGQSREYNKNPTKEKSPL